MIKDKKQLIELLGFVAVVLSLVFVGIQLILDRRLAVAERYDARAESIMSNFRVKMESDTYLSALGKRWDYGERPNWWNDELETMAQDIGLTGSEVWAEIYDHTISLEAFDAFYFQYQQGLLPDIYWNGAQNALRRGLANPLQRAVYLNIPRPITGVIREIAEEQN